MPVVAIMDMALFFLLLLMDDEEVNANLPPMLPRRKRLYWKEDRMTDRVWFQVQYDGID